jgi:hypothetical protein
MSMKHSNRSCDLLVCSAVPQPLRHRVPPLYTRCPLYFILLRTSYFVTLLYWHGWWRLENGPKYVAHMFWTCMEISGIWSRVITCIKCKRIKFWYFVVTFWTPGSTVKALPFTHTMYICVLYSYQTNCLYFRTKYWMAGFITEADSVYCTVRTESLNAIHVNHILYWL